MKRYNFVETGMGYKRLVEDPQGEFIRYEDIKKYEQVLLDAIEALKIGKINGN